MNSDLENIRNNFLEFVTSNKLIKKNDKIVVGLSGGPDSICLISLLNDIRDRMDLTIVAAHINHMLRGEEADGDEEYARQVCERMDIKFFSKKVNVSEYAKVNKLSSEAAGRKVRYDFFNHIVQTNNMNKIATAHNANDQAETVLMRIMRGTGLEGLGGILAKRDNIIRPILFLDRREVELYCSLKGLEPRIDNTNLQRIYSRNKIRLDIIPYMKENFNKDVINAINRMSILLQEDNTFIEKEVSKYYDKYVIENIQEVIIRKQAFALDNCIISRIIRRAVGFIYGNKYDLEMKHIHEILQLQKLSTGKKIDIPANVYAINVYGDLYLKTKCIMCDINKYNIKVPKNELDNKKVIFGEYSINFEILDCISDYHDKNNLIKYFDYNIIKDSITIRTRKDGDKMIPLGMSSNKKLKDIFINMKIPKLQRDVLPILQFDDEIAWVVSVKLGDKFKITSKTNKILKITVCREV